MERKSNKFRFHQNLEKYILFIQSTDLTSNCEYCNKTEDNLHLFTACNRMQKLWTHFQPTYQKLRKKYYTPHQHIFTLGSNKVSTKKNNTYTNTNHYLRNIQPRYNLKYDKTQLTQQTIITKIITQLKNILNAHYKLHKLIDTLTKFQQLFCVNNALAKIHNSKLQILIR